MGNSASWAAVVHGVTEVARLPAVALGYHQHQMLFLQPLIQCPGLAPHCLFLFFMLLSTSLATILYHFVQSSLQDFKEQRNCSLHPVPQYFNCFILNRKEMRECLQWRKEGKYVWAGTSNFWCCKKKAKLFMQRSGQSCQNVYIIHTFALFIPKMQIHSLTCLGRLGTLRPQTFIKHHHHHNVYLCSYK